MNLIALASEHLFWLYVLVSTGGALGHWWQKVRRGEASSDFFGYWFAETPGYSLGMVSALVGGWFVLYQTKGLVGMDPVMVAMSAFTFGFAVDSMVAPGSVKVISNGVDKAAGFVRLSMLPWLLVLAVLAACAGATPRDARDGSQYARGTLDAVYDTATYLRKTNRLDDAGKQKILDVGASFETVLQIVESGKNPVGECLTTVNSALSTAGASPLVSAASCLDAAIQGLTALRNVLEANNGSK